MLDLAAQIAAQVQPAAFDGQRVLLIVPDRTRTCPVGEIFRQLYGMIAPVAERLDVLVALGTHPPLPEEELCELLDVSSQTRRSDFPKTEIFNHHWSDPDCLKKIGVVPRREIRELTEGRLDEDLPVRINSMIFKYDHLLIVGPVFPHEVAGFSGGTKYFFPGISGPDVIDLFHWLGGLIGNVNLIGRIDTPVRRIFDRAAQCIDVPVTNLALVMNGKQPDSIFYGGLHETWRAAAERSLQINVRHMTRRYKTVFSCAPKMYDDLWTGAKCFYKAEPVVEDGGTLIIYAPHIKTFSYSHPVIEKETGVHVIGWYTDGPGKELIGRVPRTVLGVASYMKGAGEYRDGMERPRINLVLATGIPEEICRRCSVGYLNPATVDPEEWKRRDDDNFLFIERGGEVLYLPQKSGGDA
jgi:nickel-dependent lactate racemase